MIVSSQIRAARALLRWSAENLASNAGVGVATIRRLELTEGIPSSNAQTINLIKKTFESAGIEFLGNPEDGAGVRFRPQP